MQIVFGKPIPPFFSDPVATEVIPTFEIQAVRYEFAVVFVSELSLGLPGVFLVGPPRLSLKSSDDTCRKA